AAAPGGGGGGGVPPGASPPPQVVGPPPQPPETSHHRRDGRLLRGDEHREELHGPEAGEGPVAGYPGGAPGAGGPRLPGELPRARRGVWRPPRCLRPHAALGPPLENAALGGIDLRLIVPEKSDLRMVWLA